MKGVLVPMLTIDKRILHGPVLGLGFSGQAGSSFPTLGTLIRIQEWTRERGQAAQTVFAFDPQSNPAMVPIIEQVARQHGIQLAYIPEVPISAYRQAVGAGHMYFYGLSPDLAPYVAGELDLLARYRPSLIVSLLRPTVSYSRSVYWQRTGCRVPFMGIGYGLLLGSAGPYGIPANFVPCTLPLFLENMLSRNALIALLANRILRYKIGAADRYMQRHLAELPDRANVSTAGFLGALLGDVTLVPTCPTLVPGEIGPNVYPVGSIDLQLPLSRDQIQQQEAILGKLSQWKAKGCSILFLAMGTTGLAFPQVLSAALSFCRRVPELKILVATTILKCSAETRDVIHTLEASDAIAYSDWFQLDKILPWVDLVLSHGGVNTIEAAILHGIPLLLVAPQQAEQGLTALVVQRAGLGQVVWRHRMGSLETVLQEMLERIDAFKEKVTEHRSRLSDYYLPAEKKKRFVEALNRAFELNAEEPAEIMLHS